MPKFGLLHLATSALLVCLTERGDTSIPVKASWVNRENHTPQCKHPQLCPLWWRNLEGYWQSRAGISQISTKKCTALEILYMLQMKRHVNTQNNIRIKKILPKPLQTFLNLSKVNMDQELFPMPRRERDIYSVKPSQKITFRYKWPSKPALLLYPSVNAELLSANTTMQTPDTSTQPEHSPQRAVH